MKSTLIHLPLEPYKSRYTEFLQEWEHLAFAENFNVKVVTPPQDKVVLSIATGEVLDSRARPLWAMNQISQLIRASETDLGKLYFSDFYHPGLDALAYARKRFKAYSFCWAQTFDKYDFTYKHFLQWMRPWELMALELYETVFVANEMLADLINAAVPAANVQVVGLPFNSAHVFKQIDVGFEVEEKFDVVFSSRLDAEKNPHFFLDLVEAMPNLRFCICTAHDEIRSNQPGVKNRIDQMTSSVRKKSNLTVFTGLTKGQYYAILANSRVQFNCLSGDTLVLTKTGAFPIKDLAGKHATLLTPSGKWERVPVKKFGKQKLYELTFGRGSNSEFKVKATAGHKWKLSNGRFVTTQQLRHGDIMAQVALQPEIESKRDYEEGVRHGIVFGDGSWRKHSGGYALRLCGKKKALLKYFGDFPRSYPPSCSGDPMVYMAKSKVPNYWKELPRMYNADYLLGFFRGWLATDGSVLSKVNNYSLSGTPENIEWARRHSAIIGWLPAGISHGSSVGRKPTDRLTFYSDTLGADDVLLPVDCPKAYRPKSYVFKEAKPLGVEEVYCAQVPTEHAFCLWNGMVTGNCAHQDWVSFTLLEALTFGCYPVYPMFRSFTEEFAADPSNLYEREELGSAIEHIKYALESKKDYPKSAEILQRHDTALFEISETIKNR